MALRNLMSLIYSQKRILSVFYYVKTVLQFFEKGFRFPENLLQG